MTKRINRHQIIIDGIQAFLDTLPDTTMTIVLHTTSVKRMPKNLVGIPDLIVSSAYRTIFVEVKPMYDKSRRDTLRDAQIEFLLRVVEDGLVSDHTNYWIVEDSKTFECLWLANIRLYIPEYHQKAVDKYLESRE